jgi:hypothetical protein
MNRFGISFLSKSRQLEALDEEVMIHKGTGEVVLKGLTGEILSYNKVSRFNDHVNKVTNMCHTLNLLGKMYEIEFDAIDVPEVIVEGANLLDSYALMTTNKRISKMLISIDLDNLKIVSPDVSINVNQPEISIDMIMAVNSTQSTTYSISKSLPLDQFNSFVFIPEYPAEDPGDVVDYTIQIALITVDRSGDDLLTDNLRYVLNSVICVVKEEV